MGKVIAVMGRLFGTDGARGVAGSELSAELAMEIGRAAAMVLTQHCTHTPTLLIGRDTRRSGGMLEAALAAGITSVGAHVRMLGVLPTPAVAYLVRAYQADAGVMISASHNPAKYNGIKLFSHDGYKLSDALEAEIEALVLDHVQPYTLQSGDGIGSVSVAENAADDYIRYLISLTHASFQGIRVAIDCANGSASVTAERLFTSLGASVVMLHNTPDGLNINENCGSTHIEAVAEAVRSQRCQLGLAFDGDADRCLAVDENGNLVDGDKLIAIFAQAMRAAGTLRSDTAVVTVMSNLGFFKFAEREGIRTAITKVGDRYVLEEMRAHGYNLGGEQSGHIIFGEDSTTGDGQLTALRLLEVLADRRTKLSKLAAVMERYPQVLLGIRAEGAAKRCIDEDPTVRAAIDDCSRALGEDGRILVRASGTEPLIRVMLEGRNFEKINALALSVAEVIRQAVKHD